MEYLFPTAGGSYQVAKGKDCSMKWTGVKGVLLDCGEDEAIIRGSDLACHSFGRRWVVHQVYITTGTIVWGLVRWEITRLCYCNERR